jgi:hypothetical protein
MRIKCPQCQSEELDQGVDEKILCHNPECGITSVIVPILEFMQNLRDLER